MAPTTQPNWTLPIRSVKHSLFRRDINDGSLVSLIITAIILSILVVGISIYLFRKTWSKVIEPRLDRRRSPSTPIKGKTSYKLPSLRPQLTREKTEPILPTYRQSMHTHSYSDALWSSQLDNESYAAMTDDDSSISDSQHYLPRYSSRKSSSCSFSRQHYLSLSLSSNSAFSPLDMQTIQEGVEPMGGTTTSSSPSSKPARPGMPRRSLSETQVMRSRGAFEHETTPTKNSPLRSHPVNLGVEDKTSMHRCSGSFDAAQRSLSRPRSASRLVEVEGELL